ncbi:MAG: DUF4342 domain-containing protein [bacterium]|nr:DUF4342 domain-containing protein [bacterium]
MNKDKITVCGNDALNVVKDIVKKGNVTRILIKDKDGNLLLNIPVTLIAIGSLLSPLLAGAAFILSLVKECTIEIDKE